MPRNLLNSDGSSEAQAYAERLAWEDASREMAGLAGELPSDDSLLDLRPDPTNTDPGFGSCLGETLTIVAFVAVVVWVGVRVWNGGCEVKQYYSKDGIVIWHGDVRDAASVVDEDWADAAIADPPYGETSLAWDRWPERWVSAIGPLIKPTGSLWCFGSLRMFLDRRDDFVFWKMSHEVVWEKHNGSGFFTDRFRRVHELAVHFYPCGTAWGDVYKSPRFTLDATKRVVRKKQKPAQWHGATGSTTYVSEDGGPRLMRSVIKVRSCHGHALNETQKPEGIVRPLLEYACATPGNLLVPFVGSGTDLIVARELGLNAIGFEVREQQCEIAATRLAQGVLDFAGGAR